jgi:hypothetical protein
MIARLALLLCLVAAAGSVAAAAGPVAAAAPAAVPSRAPAPDLESMPAHPPPFVPTPAARAFASAQAASNRLAHTREQAVLRALAARVGACDVAERDAGAWTSRLARAEAIDRHAAALGKVQADAKKGDKASVAAVAALAGAAAALAVKSAIK